MTDAPWADWAIVKLQECYMRGLGADETAALLGKTKDDVCEKARELGLVAVPAHDSPATAPTHGEPFPRRTRLREGSQTAIPGIFSSED